MRLVWTSAIVAAAAVAYCLPASAEERRDAYTPEAQQSRVGVEVDFFHKSSSIVTADVVAQIGVTRHVFIDADIPMGLFVGEGQREAVFGAPMIGAHYAGRFNRRTSGFVGLAVGIPIAGATNPHLSDELASFATMVRAWHDPYRFFPHTVPAIARAGLEVDLAPAFLRFELSPGLLMDFRNNSAAAYVDAAATVGLRARFGLEGGLRGLGTFVMAITEDHAQTAIEPFIGYATPERIGLYARYGLLVALDAPLGIGGLGLITHRFSLGAKF